MARHFTIIGGSLALGAALAVAVAAQAPRIVNGRVSEQPAGSPLAGTFTGLVASGAEVVWIGYTVPVVGTERTMCCTDSGSTYISGSVISVDRASCCMACRLEPSSTQSSVGSRPSAPVAPIQLEASDRMTVLFRVSERRVERIRVFSSDCELDAGGRAVIWLDDVRPAESIALLESFATAPDRRDRVVDGAVSAIALHRDAAADAALERLVSPNQPAAVRRKVTFWLGNARGARGLDLLRGILKNDPSAEVRRSAVFGVSQSREPGAFDLLRDIARTGTEPRLRSEAVFWIAQTDDGRGPAIILEALEKDPSPEVRKKAVFALSQLKNDAGVEPLIHIARTHSSPAVRGEAIFWLGQKAGVKASAAITERIEQDPETEVKKRAVFALSQLPKDEGVPLLIKVARTNSNPAVRKQAMFWLAQSKDPRAVEFFAEILK